MRDCEAYTMDDSWLKKLMHILQEGMNRGETFLVPAAHKDDAEQFALQCIVDDDGACWLVAFTIERELQKGPETEYIECSIDNFLQSALDNQDIAGVIINPWNEAAILDKNQIAYVLSATEEYARDRNEMISLAIHYATDMHMGQMRKGTHIPYIVHPLETMQILLGMDADFHLLIAGILHDVLEDTHASAEDIQRMFGRDVSHLVQLHSEDKSKTWVERKQHTIDSLQDGPIRYRMLVMADKVSNLRAIARDYAALGDDLWARFNRGKEMQSWYYSAVQDALYDMQFDPHTEAAYWEMVALYKDVFVTFYYDDRHESIYSVSTHGENYVLHKDTMQWIAYNVALPEQAVIIPRYQAEQLEDMWAREQKSN